MLPIIFFVSAFFIAVLLGSKLVEQRNKRPFFVLRVVGKLDRYVILGETKVKDFFTKKQAYFKLFITQELPKHVRYLLLAVKLHMKRKYDDFVQSMRGVRTIKTSRDASPFLKDIKRYKEEAGEGAITESVFDALQDRS